MIVGKRQLADKIAEKTGITKEQAGQAVNALAESVTESLARGHKVRITGFGTFETRDRKARKGVSPSDGNELMIPEKTVPYFKAGKDLKNSVQKTE